MRKNFALKQLSDQEVAATRLLWAHLELGCLVKIGGTDTLPDDVPVSATRGQAHPLLYHDVLELSPHFPDLEQDTGQRRMAPASSSLPPLTPTACSPELLPLPSAWPWHG